MADIHRLVISEDQRARAIKDLCSASVPFRLEIKKPESPATLSMKRTWRMWMRETAKWMATNGATMPLYYRPNGEPVGKRPFNKDDAHEAFMRIWGGIDGNEDREHQERVGKPTLLYMMDKHLAWASERGIPLTIPKEGEYMRATRESER